jgi:hypothetical protein
VLLLLLLLTVCEWLCIDGGPWHGTAGDSCALRKLVVPVTTTNICPQWWLASTLSYADRFGEQHVKLGGTMVR